MSNNYVLDNHPGESDIVFPVLRFEPLIEKTEEELKRYIYDSARNLANGFLVIIRNKYIHDKDWEYSIEFCMRYEVYGIMWEMDWFEGQQQVEYLGVCTIPSLDGKGKEFML